MKTQLEDLGPKTETNAEITISGIISNKRFVDDDDDALAQHADHGFLLLLTILA